MPRKLRHESPGAIHHVCAHAVEGENVFRDDGDRVGYTQMLAATVARFNWLCLGYCLMGNHVHLLIETPDANLGCGVQWLHSTYVRAFNKRYRRDGHLFRARHVAEPVMREAHLLQLCSYIPFNPVRAGFCSDPAEWRWGSHFSVARGEPADWLAHHRLLERITDILGAPVYDQLIDAQRLLTVPDARRLTPGV